MTTPKPLFPFELNPDTSLFKLQSLRSKFRTDPKHPNPKPKRLPRGSKGPTDWILGLTRLRLVIT